MLRNRCTRRNIRISRQQRRFRPLRSDAQCARLPRVSAVARLLAHNHLSLIFGSKILIRQRLFARKCTKDAFWLNKRFLKQPLSELKQNELVALCYG